MRSTTDRLGRIAPFFVALLIVSCGPSSPSPSASEPDQMPTPSTSATARASEPSASVSASAAPSAEAGPGRPYDAAAILDAMRASPRPDGVPSELQTDAIAAAIAAEIWTIDGARWDAMTIGATCGASSCLVEVSGSRDGTDGDDTWTFAVDRESGDVTVGATDLRALPRDVVDDMDRLARSVVDDAPIGAMALASIAWLPPVDAGRFALSYRTGGEEGSCGVDLVLDAEDERIVDQQIFGDC